jgi:hypothetical protein
VLSKRTSSFHGFQHQGGYVWIKGAQVQPSGPDELISPDEWLMVPAMARQGDAAIEYAAAADFFLAVAGLQLDREAIADFAASFGTLGVDQMVVTIPEGGDLRPGMARADRWSSWQNFLFEFGQALGLRVHIDQVYLAKRLGVWDTPTILLSLPGIYSTSWGRTQESVVDDMRGLEIISISEAERRLFQLIDANIRTLTRNHLVELPRGAKARPEWELRPEGNGVAGIAWAQLGLLTTQQQLRRCANCSRFILVTSPRGGERKTRLTCSGKCRTAIHLRRKAEALQLYKTGKHVSEIASLLDTTQVRIRTWVGAAHGKSSRRGGRG